MNSFWQKIRGGERDASLALAGIVLAVYLVVLIVAGIMNIGQIGKSPIYPTSLPVDGKGEVMAVPNIASFSYSVVEEGKDVAEAQDKATKKNNAIIDYLKGKNIDAKDIKTSSYNIYPKYEYNPTTGKQTLNGYEVNISVAVKVRKTDTAGEILSQVGTWGVSYVSGLDFTVDDVDALKREARDLAIEDAKEQARVLAKKLGVHLGDIVSYYEVEDYPSYPMYDSYDYYGGGDMMAKEAVAPQIESGEQKITAKVNISFEIRD
ncbi:MAG: hypothetical protein RLY57_477 [Candidatus Parcubacteria bacterium]|jgi:uncharacterized protein YggE